MAVGKFANTQYGLGTVVDTPVNASSNGNNAATSGIPGYRQVLILGDLCAAGAVTVTVQSSGGNVLDGPMAFAANGGKIYPETERGHFATEVGEGITINLGGAVQVGGHIKYALVQG